MTYGETMVLPKNCVSMQEDEMRYTEGGGVVLLVGVTVTISIFTWGQGEKDAKAWINKYGKIRAQAMGLRAMGLFGVIFPPSGVAYMAGFWAQYNRM